jgi:hypothetical protein
MPVTISIARWARCWDGLHSCLGGSLYRKNGITLNVKGSILNSWHWRKGHEWLLQSHPDLPLLSDDDFGCCSRRSYTSKRCSHISRMRRDSVSLIQNRHFCRAVVQQSFCTVYLMTAAQNLAVQLHSDRAVKFHIFVVELPSPLQWCVPVAEWSIIEVWKEGCTSRTNLILWSFPVLQALRANVSMLCTSAFCCECCRFSTVRHEA